MTLDHVTVGQVGRPHGVKGEVTVRSETDHPGRFVAGAVLRTTDGGTLVIDSVKPFRDAGFIVHFEGVEGREGAEALRGTTLTVPSEERRALEEGEWWVQDLVGLTAVDPDGRILGTVSEVESGPQDRLVIATPEGAEVMVPFVTDLVGDPEGGQIVIRPPEGLFEE